MRKIYSVNHGVQKIKTAADRFKTLAAFSFTGLVAAVAVPLGAHAAPTSVIVTPSNAQGWSTADTRPGGAVNFVLDSSAPGSPSNGALELTTDNTNAAKAQYLHATNTSLANISQLSYYTKQNSANSPAGDPSYQVATCLGGFVDGSCVGFTNLVYEPYWNGTVVPGAWQQWDVTSGEFWSSGTYSDGAQCSVTAGGGGAPFYTLSALQANCPKAIVTGFGVNVGSYNPGYNVEVDLLNFNGTTYNFEPYQVATDKDACKNDGWKTLSAVDGGSFKNQGACVSYVASDGKSQH